MVSNAHNDLVNLVRLQTVYDSIAEAIAEHNTPPAEIRSLQEANRLRLEELEEMERQLEAHGEEIKEVRKKEAEWELELEHFQKQKGMVTNEREFTAVISEIRQARPEEETAQSEVVTSWESRKEKLLKKVHELSDHAKTIEAEIQPKNRARFMRLLESKQGTSVSKVVDGSCSLCHFALRPHLQQRVRRCEEIIDCEHCHRILYIEETVRDDIRAAEQ
jgi:predicted  nucleic acid-binding Zn-ribbon protein